MEQLVFWLQVANLAVSLATKAWALMQSVRQGWKNRKK